MTSVYSFLLSLMILFTANFAHAAGDNPQTEEALKIYNELNMQSENGDQPFMELMSKFVQATAAAGRCTGSWDCSWPTTQCVNNRCVKSNGDAGECRGNYDCSWPTSECRNGRCVKSNGDGGECRGNYDCSWPYSNCRKGFCER